MISAIEALHYRSLRYVRQEVAPFQLLVGPNASGKSTFLDVVGLIGDLLKDGLGAVRRRSPNLSDLVWLGRGKRVELAVELRVPANPLRPLESAGPATARYEVALGTSGEQLALLDESLWLRQGHESAQVLNPVSRFPRSTPPLETILSDPQQRHQAGWSRPVSKELSGAVVFRAEGGPWQSPFRFGAERLALGTSPRTKPCFRCQSGSDVSCSRVLVGSYSTAR